MFTNQKPCMRVIPVYEKEANSVIPLIKPLLGTCLNTINNKRKSDRAALEQINNNGFTSYIKFITGFNSVMNSFFRPNQVTKASIRFRNVR